MQYLSDTVFVSFNVYFTFQYTETHLHVRQNSGAPKVAGADTSTNFGFLKFFNRKLSITSENPISRIHSFADILIEKDRSIYRTT